MMMILAITKQIQGCKAQRWNPLIVMMMKIRKKNLVPFLLLLISFTRFKIRVA
jgi:hypothetical protein